MTQNAQQREDLRVRRSRKMLQEALIELTVEKKGFTTVTVRDITERAMVNRATFYRHYLDKCDLVEKYMDEVYELLTSDEKLTVSLKSGQVRNDVPSGLLNMLRHVQQFADFYRIMLGVEGDPGFTERFRQNSERRFREFVARREKNISASSLPFEMRIKYVAHASVGAIVWWLENDQPCTVEELASWLSQLSYPIWSGTHPAGD